MEQEPAQHQQSSLLSSYEWWRGNFLRTLNRTKSWRRVVVCCDRTSAQGFGECRATAQRESGQSNRRECVLCAVAVVVVMTLSNKSSGDCDWRAGKIVWTFYASWISAAFWEIWGRVAAVQLLYYSIRRRKTGGEFQRAREVNWNLQV